MPPKPDPLPISALQHLIFCERQCALIHIEGLWAENRLTVEGRALHRKAHAEDVGPRGGGRHTTRTLPTPSDVPGDPAASTVHKHGLTIRTVRGLALASESLNLIGKADIVEFHSLLGGNASPQALPIVATPFPIEYKRGRPKAHDADKVQLCAQALCLEDMLGVPSPAGALFYGQTRRRLDVAFDAALRAKTLDAIERLRRLIEVGVTPRVPREKKCDRCSMLHLCLPDGTGPSRSAVRYIESALGALSPRCLHTAVPHASIT